MDLGQLEDGKRYGLKNYLNFGYDKKFILKHFQFHNSRILDFGCGMGSTSLWLAKNTNCIIHAIDIDPNHIEIAKLLQNELNIKDVNFYVYDILTKPMDIKFDYILMIDVIEHIEISKVSLILKKLIHCLSETGKIFISYPPWYGPWASHLNKFIKLPWCQYLPIWLLKKMISLENQKLAGVKSLFHEFEALNRLTPKKLNPILTKNSYKIFLRHNHSIFNRIFNKTGLIKLNLLFKLLVTREYLIIEHTSADNS